MKKILTIILIAVFAFSCTDSFEKMNRNPNTPAEVTSALLATKHIVDMAKKGNDKNFVYDLMLAKYITSIETADDYVFNRLSSVGLNYNELTSIKEMINYSVSEDKDAYRGLAYYIKVNNLFNSTMQLGDIPYHEAGMGEQGIRRPKFDTQKEVFIQLLNDLDSASLCFGRATKSFAGDPLFNGNISKWAKLTNALRIKMLIQLSKKESDPDLKLKDRFTKAITNHPLMTSNADNFQLAYADKAGMYYPYSKIATQHYLNARLSSLLIDTLIKHEDYRVFYYAEPAGYQINTAGLPMDDFNAYMGVDVSMPFADQRKQNSDNKISALNNRYVLNNAGEPVIRVGYAEQQFILAEAAARGLISGDASTYYKEGIRAAMSFVADNTPANKGYEHNRPITAIYISNYVNKPEIQLTGDIESKVAKIMTQKHLAGFMHFKWDAYYDYRRTGYPVFKINPATSTNDDGFKDKLPVRWRYAQGEYNTNRANLVEALVRQFGSESKDANNELMWILK